MKTSQQLIDELIDEFEQGQRDNESQFFLLRVHKRIILKGLYKLLKEGKKKNAS